MTIDEQIKISRAVVYNGPVTSWKVTWGLHHEQRAVIVRPGTFDCVVRPRFR
ncbi:hypothetical protein [Streptomyces sp. UNOC14_S4]|uniref:hypothetical protein n=1 Tax=Streptomyces sp. UNOC14_S4 TaxID=2872340 RepID=UPI001E4ADFA5|nr:hypothetical protein [Streptomyces sp. UNOC14_S4]MCC3766473.1 hypothetical protein [Streptomyces sp. UNOC14_S4]